MKKLFAFVLSLTMIFALTACGGEANKPSDPPANDTVAPTDPVETPTPPAADPTKEGSEPAGGAEAIDTTVEIAVVEQGMSNLKVTGTPGQTLKLEGINKAGELNNNYYQYNTDGTMIKHFLVAFTGVTYDYTYVIADKAVTEIVDASSGQSTIENLKGIGMFEDVQNTVAGDDEAIQAWFSETYGMSIADYLAG